MDWRHRAMAPVHGLLARLRSGYLAQTSMVHSETGKSSYSYYFNIRVLRGSVAPSCRSRNVLEIRYSLRLYTQTIYWNGRLEFAGLLRGYYGGVFGTEGDEKRDTSRLARP